MTNHNKTKPAPKRWKQVLAHELFEYLFNFAFLTAFFVAFTCYRRLILAAYHIEYLGYWVPVIEAAILAKVIMIGEIMHLGRRFQDKPLAVVTLYRTAVFGVFVVLFKFLEAIVGAMIHGKPAAEGITEITNKGLDQVLAYCVLILVVFVPFFAMKEIERVFGAEKIRGLFFQRQAKQAETRADDASEPANRSND
jgi:hypothetical protein